MKNLVKRFKNERGLTLVELLAVIVILAIVGAIAVVAINNVIDNSRKDAHVANAQQVLSAAELERASGGEILGSAEDLDTLQDLIDPWNDEEGSEGYDFTINVSNDSENEGTITISSAHDECSFTNADREVLTTGRDACGYNEGS